LWFVELLRLSEIFFKINFLLLAWRILQIVDLKIKYFLNIYINIRLVQKFLPIFCNFFIIIKKSIQYKLIEVFSIVFLFFSSFCNFSTTTERPDRSLLKISKSLFLNRLNQFTHVLMAIIFSSHVSQMILCASAALFF